MITQILKIDKHKAWVWFQYLQTHLAQSLARDTTMELQERIFVGMSTLERLKCGGISLV